MSTSPKHSSPLSPVLLRLALLLAVLLGTVSCSRQSDTDSAAITLQWSIEPSPPHVGEAEFSCTVWDSLAAAPVTGAAVHLEGNMAHAGMQPVFSTAHEVSPGHYAATLSFTMAGDWFVLLDIKLADGRSVQRQVDVNGVQPR